MSDTRWTWVPDPDEKCPKCGGPTWTIDEMGYCETCDCGHSAWACLACWEWWDVAWPDERKAIEDWMRIGE